MAQRFSQTVSNLIAWLRDAFRTPVSRNVRLLRPRHPRMIAGVFSGAALAYNCDVNVLRVLAVVFAFVSFGLVVAGYAVAWVLIPEGTYELPNPVRSPLS